MFLFYNYTWPVVSGNMMYTRITISIKAKIWTGRKTNNNTCRVSELNKISKYKCIRLEPMEIKFVAKLLNYRKLFKDILTFLGIDYRDASHIKLYLVVIGWTLQNSEDNYIIQKVFNNQLVLNECLDFLVIIIELLRFLSRT